MNDAKKPPEDAAAEKVLTIGDGWCIADTALYRYIGQIVDIDGATHEFAHWASQLKDRSSLRVKVPPVVLLYPCYELIVQSMGQDENGTEAYSLNAIAQACLSVGSPVYVKWQSITLARDMQAPDLAQIRELVMRAEANKLAVRLMRKPKARVK